jgi:ketohexokinase
MCSSATSSRTITYTNPVPELSFDELWTTLAPLYHPASQSKVKWIHFEGRNPDTVVQVLQKIAQTDSDRIRLSVELEKPARTQLLQVESLADVVFYSQEWARHYGFTDAQAFLQSRASFAKPGAAMFCTWGADGAAVYDATTHQMSFAKPPVIARVQDTVGAGDTFNAGVLYAFSLHKTPKEAVEYGCRMAALKVSGIPAKELAQHFT